MLLLSLFCCISVKDGADIYHLVSKFLYQLNVLETELSLLTVTIYTLPTNHTLSEYFCQNKLRILSLVRKHLHDKKVPLSRIDVSSNF